MHYTRYFYGFNVNCNQYNNSDCKLEVLEMTDSIEQKDAKGNIIGYVQFPHVYKITLGDVVYILDGKYYGECVTTELTGNLHYSGSAILSQNNKKVGTGFMEANQFQNKEMYSKTTLSYIDLETGDLVKIQELIDGIKAYGIDYTKTEFHLETLDEYLPFELPGGFLNFLR